VNREDRAGVHRGDVENAESNTTESAARRSRFGAVTLNRPYAGNHRPRSWQWIKTTFGGDPCG